jgi:hypothetical protein
MSKMTLDSTTSGKFRQVNEQVELIDESGHPLGTFIPVHKKTNYRDVEVPFSSEEIRRLAEQKGGRTLAEILADMERGS